MSSFLAGESELDEKVKEEQTGVILYPSRASEREGESRKRLGTQPEQAARVLREGVLGYTE